MHTVSDTACSQFLNHLNRMDIPGSASHLHTVSHMACSPLLNHLNRMDILGTSFLVFNFLGLYN